MGGRIPCPKAVDARYLQFPKSILLSFPKTPSTILPKVENSALDDEDDDESEPDDTLICTQKTANAVTQQFSVELQDMRVPGTKSGTIKEKLEELCATSKSQNFYPESAAAPSTLALTTSAVEPAASNSSGLSINNSDGMQHDEVTERRLTTLVRTQNSDPGVCRDNDHDICDAPGSDVYLARTGTAESSPTISTAVQGEIPRHAVSLTSAPSFAVADPESSAFVWGIGNKKPNADDEAGEPVRMPATPFTQHLRGEMGIDQHSYHTPQSFMDTTNVMSSETQDHYIGEIGDISRSNIFDNSQSLPQHNPLHSYPTSRLCGTVKSSPSTETSSYEMVKPVSPSPAFRGSQKRKLDAHTPDADYGNSPSSDVPARTCMAKIRFADRQKEIDAKKEAARLANEKARRILQDKLALKKAKEEQVSLLHACIGIVLP